MSLPQRQDLTLFSDQSVLPRELLNGDGHHMFLVTSTMATQPLWLLTALIETKIKGAPLSLNGSAARRSENPATQEMKTPVVVASFLHEHSFYHQALQKLRINANAYKVVDLLTGFVQKCGGKPRDVVLKELLEQFTPDSQSTILIEQPELLLSLLDGLTSDELNQKFLQPLRKKCNLLIVSSSIDLFQDNENDPLDGSRGAVEYTRFISSLIYTSIVVMNLRSLETGRAKDVTGSLMISRGGQTPAGLSVHVVENEYLYLTEKENTRLFYR